MARKMVIFYHFYYIFCPHPIILINKWQFSSFFTYIFFTFTTSFLKIGTIPRLVAQFQGLISKSVARHFSRRAAGITSIMAILRVKYCLQSGGLKVNVNYLGLKIIVVKKQDCFRGFRRLYKVAGIRKWTNIVQNPALWSNFRGLFQIPLSDSWKNLYFGQF